MPPATRRSSLALGKARGGVDRALAVGTVLVGVARVAAGLDLSIGAAAKGETRYHK